MAVSFNQIGNIGMRLLAVILLTKERSNGNKKRRLE